MSFQEIPKNFVFQYLVSEITIGLITVVAVQNVSFVFAMCYVHDNRLKLDEYKRVIVKMYDLIYHYRKIGKIWHKSAKWIKQLVEDPALQKIIDQADKCPQCSFDFADFFNKQTKRADKGLEVRMPQNFTVDWERKS